MKPTTIDEYIAGFPSEVQSILQNIRMVVREQVPGATERISYDLAAFHYKGPLVYFGAFKAHIGFYPPVRDPSLLRESAKYAGPKGNLRFSLGEPIPYELIGKLVAARMQENEATEGARESRRG